MSAVGSARRAARRQTANDQRDHDRSKATDRNGWLEPDDRRAAQDDGDERGDAEREEGERDELAGRTRGPAAIGREPAGRWGGARTGDLHGTGATRRRPSWRRPADGRPGGRRPP